MRSVLARERPPTCLMDSGGVGRAWPTVHCHSWVLHPGRSHLPGHMIVVRIIFRQIAACIMALPPGFYHFDAFCQISRVQIAVRPFSRNMRPVLTQEHSPTCLIHSGGVPGAWRIVHGHSQVWQPGCSVLLGTNQQLLRILAHGRSS